MNTCASEALSGTSEIILGEFDIKKFIIEVFSRQPAEKKSFRIELSGTTLDNFLFNFTLYGAAKLYDKYIDELDEEENIVMNKYLGSIGFYYISYVEEKYDDNTGEIIKQKNTSINHLD
jgi:hypothetical protein